MFIDFTANQAGVAPNLLRYPVDIIGATDPHTIVWRWFAYSYKPAANQFRWGNVVPGESFALDHLSNTGGTVTARWLGGPPPPLICNTRNIYFSTATDPAFIGACTEVTYSTSSGYLSCKQSGSAGHTSAGIKAKFAFGDTPFGNTEFTLWPGAEVIDVQDEAQDPPKVNGKFTLELNSVAWSVGDAIEEPHHYGSKSSPWLITEPPLGRSRLAQQETLW